jgi:hypothetical protein
MPHKAMLSFRGRRKPLRRPAPQFRHPHGNVWDYLRGKKLSSLVWNHYEAKLNACVEAWNFIANDPAQIASFGTRPWARVKG